MSGSPAWGRCRNPRREVRSTALAKPRSFWYEGSALRSRESPGSSQERNTEKQCHRKGGLLLTQDVVGGRCRPDACEETAEISEREAGTEGSEMELFLQDFEEERRKALALRPMVKQNTRS